MGDSSANPTYTLDQLAKASGILERTIRSYIARGLLPPPEGRGRAANYGPEHLVRLKFIQAVRIAAHPYELPLAKIEELLRTMPPEQVARVASGEEKLHAAFMGELDPSLLRRRRPEVEGELSLVRSPAIGLPMSFATLRTPSHVGEPEKSFGWVAPSGSRTDLWLGIDVTRDVRLSMRASEPAAEERLADLARRLRGWLEGGPGP